MDETTILLSGAGVEISADFDTPLYEKYKIALQSLSTFYSWPNVDSSNNKLVYRRARNEKTITFPEGAYEIKDLSEYIRNRLKVNGDDEAFRLGASFNTLKAYIDILKDGYTVDMDKSTIKSILGWNGGVLHGVGTYSSDEKVNITNINEILVHCDVCDGIWAMYNGKISKQTVLTSFYPDVNPGDKIRFDRNKLFYSPKKSDKVSSIKVWLTDQDYKPINNGTEKLTVKLHVKSI